MPKLRNPDTGKTVKATVAGAEVLRRRGYLDVGGSNDVAASGAASEKTIDELSGKELDAFAADLGIEDWNAKAKVADKKEALKAAVAAKIEAALPDGLDDLSDDELKAKAAELNLDVDVDAADRDTLLAALRA